MSDAQRSNGQRLPLVKMVSKLGNRDEFLDAYASFVDSTSVVVFSRKPPPLGTFQRFSLHLKDGETVLAGEGEVVERSPPDERGDRPTKMRLEVRALDPGGEEVFSELLRRRRAKVRALAQRRSTPAPAPASASSARPPSEERTPGGTDTVPANPFGDITHEVLEGFIECVLHEDYDPRSREAWTEPEPEPPPEPEPERAHPVVPPPRPATPSPAVPVQAPANAPPPVVKVGVGTHLLVAVLAATAGVFGAFYLLERGDDPAPAVAREGGRGVDPTAAATPADPQPQARSASAVGTPERGAAHTADDTGDSPAADAGVAVADEATETAEANPAGAGEADGAGADAGPSIASDECVITVATHDEAIVSFDGERVGTPPIEESVACDREVEISVAHPRYETWTRTVAPQPGTPLEVVADLQRPRVSLRLASKPSGATLSVDGQIIGRAPTQARVKAFTSVWVTASLDGYKPWAKRVRLKKGSSVTAKLVPIPGAQ